MSTFTNKLLDDFLKSRGYIQYKQMLPDLGISSSQLSSIRKGERKLSDKTAIYLAEQLGLDISLVLAKLHAEHAQTPKEKRAWNQLAKTISHGTAAALAIVAAPVDAILNCVQCGLC